VSDQRPTAKYYFSSLNFAAIATRKVVTDYRTRPATMLVECNGRRVHAATVLVQVHDSYTYWGRVPLRITPDHEDGLTAVAIERLSTTAAIGLAARGLMRRPMAGVDGAHVFTEIEKLIIEAEPEALFQADGELLGTTESVEITPAYDALTVITPNR
jgi:diacylglycerol kinase family enzyme